MTRPEDELASAEAAGLQEVQAAYRGLTPVEPDAALDARVRSAVAAALADDAGATANAAANPASGRAAPGRVVPFRRWRRVALPLAAAASLVIGVGLWRTREPREATTASVAEAPAAFQPAVPATQAMADAAPAAPAMEAPAAPPLKAPASQDIQAPVAPGAAQAAARAYGSGQAALKSSLVGPEGSPFDAIRLLLAQHRRDEARALLAQWHAAHAQAPVPEDLRPLLDPVPPRDATR